MRVAVSVDNNDGLSSIVRAHFGDAPFFVLADTADGRVNHFEVVANPYHRHHQPGQVPQFLREQGADAIVSGGMGRRAISFFDSFGIQVATGAAGTAAEAVQAFLSGELCGAEPCAHEHGDHHHHGSDDAFHGHGHGHRHHHD